MTDRRNFLKGDSVAAAMGAGLVSRSALAALPEAPSSSATTLEVPPEPTSGPWFKPVVTLNSWSLPWRMKNGWKEFHLTAEAVAPGLSIEAIYWPVRHRPILQTLPRCARFCSVRPAVPRAQPWPPVIENGRTRQCPLSYSEALPPQRHDLASRVICHAQRPG